MKRERPLAAGLHRLRLHHLEVLLAIERTSSLTAAAAVLGVSQPAVSQWLADLEAALGVELFVRGRPLRGTESLAPVLRFCQRLMTDSRNLEEELEAVRQGWAGSIRIGVMLVAGPELLPKAALMLRGRDQRLQLEVIEDIADGLWPRLMRRELDLLVGRLDARAFAAEVRCEALYEDPHCVIAGARHPLRRKRAVGWADAAAYPWILPRRGTPLRNAVEATFAAHGLAAPQTWLDSASVTANEVILGRTDCLAVVSGSAARHLRSHRSVATLPLRLVNEIGPIGMVWSPDAASPALTRVMQAFRDAARGSPSAV